MRWMTGSRLSDRVTIVDLRRMTKLSPIIPLIKERKLKWYGHLKRSQTLAKTIFEGMSEGGRKQGGQPMRWRKNITKWTGLSFEEINRLTSDRDAWRQSVDTWKTQIR